MNYGHTVNLDDPEHNVSPEHAPALVRRTQATHRLLSSRWQRWRRLSGARCGDCVRLSMMRDSAFVAWHDAREHSHIHHHKRTHAYPVCMPHTSCYFGRLQKAGSVPHMPARNR